MYPQQHIRCSICTLLQSLTQRRRLVLECVIIEGISWASSERIADAVEELPTSVLASLVVCYDDVAGRGARQGCRGYSLRVDDCCRSIRERLGYVNSPST
jgi:hypothetical protein